MSLQNSGKGDSGASGRIAVSDLKKVYKSQAEDVLALEDVSVSVQDNEFLCLLGPSGCGKSTLLRIIGDLVEPTAGSLEIDNSEVGEDQPLTNMVFQEHGIFPWKTVIDNIAFGLKMRGVSKEERYEIARKYIEKVDLSGFENAYPHQLSGGMKQRVGIARAFTNDPAILLMDEPFGALDAQTKEGLQEELLEIWSESDKTTLYVTHDIEEAILLGDRIAIMSKRPGQIKEIIDVDIPRPRSRETRSLTEFIELRDEIWETISEEVKLAKQTRMQE